MTRVDICICTFRRPGIVETLESLAGLAAHPGAALRVVVADNDETPQAQALIAAAASRLGLDLAYVHAPARNICIARNACLDEARGDFAIFLDDDETVTPGWLAAMLAVAGEGWDAVLGPVRAVYAPSAPAWLRKADLHSTAPVFENGQIRKGYAGNALLRREVVERLGLRFDLSLGRQGGEDDDFFYRLTDAGGRIGFAPEALALEPVPIARTSLAWLLRRSFRTGQTHGARVSMAAASLAQRTSRIGLALTKAGVCLAGAGVSGPWAARRNRWLVRGALHLGVVNRLIGGRTLELY